MNAVDKILDAAAGTLRAGPDWLAQQRGHEIARLEAVLRNPTASLLDREIAQAQLDHWREVLAEANRTDSGWQPVMDRTAVYLLAKDLAIGEGYRSMRAAGRHTWGMEDYRVAVRTFLTLWPGGLERTVKVGTVAPDWTAT